TRATARLPAATKCVPRPGWTHVPGCGEASASPGPPTVASARSAANAANADLVVVTRMADRWQNRPQAGQQRPCRGGPNPGVGGRSDGKRGSKAHAGEDRIPRSLAGKAQSMPP